jgi:hypothetical protein
MTDLRKAAEMALEFVEWFASDDHSVRPQHKAPEVVEALRQALAQPEQEPVGYVTIETISSWAKVPSIKWFKKPTEGPLYTAPVDAVNISQERVDETAKREQEPFIYVREDNERPFGGYEHCSEADAGAFPVYTAPPKHYTAQDVIDVVDAVVNALKREWVGLTDEEIHEVVSKKWWDWEDAFDIEGFGRAIETKLKEKNT